MQLRMIRSRNALTFGCLLSLAGCKGPAASSTTAAPPAPAYGATAGSAPGMSVATNHNFAPPSSVAPPPPGWQPAYANLPGVTSQAAIQPVQPAPATGPALGMPAGQIPPGVQAQPLPTPGYAPTPNYAPPQGYPPPQGYLPQPGFATTQTLPPPAGYPPPQPYAPTGSAVPPPPVYAPAPGPPCPPGAAPSEPQVAELSKNPFTRAWQKFQARQDNFDYEPIRQKRAKMREELPYND